MLHVSNTNTSQASALRSTETTYGAVQVIDTCRIDVCARVNRTLHLLSISIAPSLALTQAPPTSEGRS